MGKSTSLSSGIVRLEKAVNQEGFILDYIICTNTETIKDDEVRFHNNAPAGEYYVVEAKILVPRTVTSPSS